MTVEFCYLLFIAGAYYFNVVFNVPGFLYRKKYVLFSINLAAILVLAAGLRTMLARYMSMHVFAPGHAAPVFTNIFFQSLLNISVWVACLLAIYLTVEKIRFRKYVDTLEKQKTQNELDFLKAQFNPHFLFNSIHSIYGHIDKNNPTARNMLLTFSEMLRYQLYECNVEAISIEKEISYIRNYTALQQIRKEEDLIVHLVLDPEVRGFSIAPLLFIAFIENAFKYVSNHDDRENRVAISLEKQGGALVFKSFNTRERNTGRPIKDSGGIGVANVKRRLELLYPEKHDLSIEETDHSYQVTLKLELA